MLWWRRRRPDPGRPLSPARLFVLQTEEYWERSRESLEMYLKARGQGYRRKALVRRVRDFMTRNAPHALEAAGRALLASLGLILPLAIDAAIEGAGAGPAVREAFRHALGIVGLLPLPESTRTAGGLGIAAVTIAGVSLPLFYTVVSTSLVRSYEGAPESVRAFALGRSFVKFFEVPAWILGIWGSLMVLAAEVGLHAGIFTQASVAALSILVLAAVPLAFWRVVASASPGALVDEKVDEIRSVIADVQEEVSERADPEMLKMLHRVAARQARAFVELASFVDKSPVRSQSSARAVTLGAAVIVGAPMPQIEVLVPTMPGSLSAHVTFPGPGVLGVIKASLSVTASAYTPQVVFSLGPDEYHGTVWRIYGLPANEEITHWDIGASAMISNLQLSSTIEGFSYGSFTDATHYRRYNFGRTASLQIYGDLDAANTVETPTRSTASRSARRRLRWSNHGHASTVPWMP